MHVWLLGHGALWADLVVYNLLFTKELDEHCDQMARLFIRYFAIYNREELPNGVKESPKKVQNFANH